MARATPEGTGAFFQRHGADPASVRRWQGLAMSSIGLGTYLGPDDEATDRMYHDAIVRAVELGINVIDSARNYRNQRSERVIGRALGDVLARGLARREELVLATKGGFLPRGDAPAGIVAGCHCMTPEYLAQAIAGSLQNLRVDSIDIYYLHNPETQLDEVARPEFLRRMRDAFEALEAACAEGHIGVYGTATWNGYRDGSLSLAELLSLAREVGGDDHRFRVVQLPYNLAMPEAYVQGLLRAFGDAGMYVMTSGSILQGRLAKLPDRVRESLPGETDAQRALEFVRSTRGVGTALVGMKRVAHVEENARLLRRAPLPHERVDALFRDS